MRSASPLPLGGTGSRWRSWGLVALLAGPLLDALPAASVTIPASRDNVIYATADLSNGAGSYLFAGRSGQGRVMRSLVLFNLAGQIPAGATIDAVSLTFGLSTPHNNANTIQLRRVLADWGEGTSISNGPAPGTGGADGAAATPGDATWNARIFNSAAWATPGGDFATTVSASQSVAGTSGTAVFASAGLIADVQAWLAAPSANFGWILLAQNETLSAVRFSSREGSLAPALTVTYTPAAVGVAPAITTPPASQTVLAGASATLAVVASGTPAPTYQWHKDGTALPGATQASLTLASPQPGSYTVTATNASGSVTSPAAVLTVVAAIAEHALVGDGYRGGDAITITNTLRHAGLPTRLSWQVLLPAGWTFVSANATTASSQPAAGATGLLEWSWSTVPPSPISFSYTLQVPAGQCGGKNLSALVAARLPGGTADATLLAVPDPLVVPWASYHSADTDRNFRIGLVELTRLIELYNTRFASARTGAYRIEAASEDGFAPDPTRANTTPVSLATYHSGDSDRNGRISLVELTRVIELFNYRAGTTRTGQYRALCGVIDTEDGFATGP